MGARLPLGYRFSTWLFLRLIGLVYLIAFASLWWQIEGLIGSRGILPASLFLERVSEALGVEGFWRFPTLAWLSASDTVLHGLCAAGVLGSILVIAGRLQAPALLALWGTYLSLAVVGQDFLSFQWDTLLLETGLLAVFLAPADLRPIAPLKWEPPRLALWLERWLLFRLMFGSGLVKLASGDAAWGDLTALQVHYETQPLPTWIGWWAHQLPAGFQRASTVAMFALELIVPFAIFLPAPFRRTACALLVGFQLTIAASGNYTFFNLLSIALCLLLIDDEAWAKLGMRPRRPLVVRGPWRGRRWALAPFAAMVLLISSMQLVGASGTAIRWPGPLIALYQGAAPLRSINRYGLFAVMTTERREIVIEGSADGREWRAYEFRWKPGDVTRRPRFVAPHQPRLDWQMWFAALGRAGNNPWFVSLLGRLAEGEPAIVRLLAHDPFAGEKPRFLRARVFDYRFTDIAGRRATGAWWRREPLGLYFPRMPAERLLGAVP